MRINRRGIRRIPGKKIGKQKKYKNYTKIVYKSQNKKNFFLPIG
jgi:hypothetical protein